MSVASYNYPDTKKASLGIAENDAGEIPYLEKPKSTFYQRWIWLTPSLLIAALLGLIIWGLRARSNSH